MFPLAFFCQSGAAFRTRAQPPNLHWKPQSYEKTRLLPCGKSLVKIPAGDLRASRVPKYRPDGAHLGNACTARAVVRLKAGCREPDACAAWELLPFDGSMIPHFRQKCNRHIDNFLTQFLVNLEWNSLALEFTQNGKWANYVRYAGGKQFILCVSARSGQKST